MHRYNVLRGRLIVALAAPVLALLPFDDAKSILVHAPEMSIDPKSGELSKLRVRYLAAARAGEFDSDVDTRDKVPLDHKETFSMSGSVDATDARGVVKSKADYLGRAKVGTLKGLTSAKVENGNARATADVYVQFMDLVQITKEGKLSVVLAVSGSVTEQVHPMSTLIGAGSVARADFFVWPYGNMPTPGQSFDFYAYRGATWTAVGPVLTDPLPAASYSVGSRWWVLGQLWLNSSATGNSLLSTHAPHALESAARFDHTAEFFIAADPLTPDAAFVSASGYDYRPLAVPEASTGLLFLGGMGLLWLRLGCKKRVQRPGIPHD